VTIRIRPLRGNFLIFASNTIDNGAPNMVNAIWRSEGYEINIPNDDPKYSKIIYLTVQNQDMEVPAFQKPKPLRSK